MPNSCATSPADSDVDPDAPYLAVLLKDFTGGSSNINAVNSQAFDPVLASLGLEAFDLALQHHNFDGAQQPTTQLLLGSPDALVDGMLVETVSEAFGSSPQQHQASPWQVQEVCIKIMSCLLCPGPWRGNDLLINTFISAHISGRMPQQYGIHTELQLHFCSSTKHHPCPQT